MCYTFHEQPGTAQLSPSLSSWPHIPPATQQTLWEGCMRCTARLLTTIASATPCPDRVIDHACRQRAKTGRALHPSALLQTLHIQHTRTMTNGCVFLSWLCTSIAYSSTSLAQRCRHYQSGHRPEQRQALPRKPEYAALTSADLVQRSRRGRHHHCYHLVDSAAETARVRIADTTAYGGRRHNCIVAPSAYSVDPRRHLHCVAPSRNAVKTPPRLMRCSTRLSREPH